MKVKFNLALVYHGNNNPLIVYPDTGEKAMEFDSMKNFLAEKFNIKRDEMVAIQVIATDGCEPTVIPFNTETARKVLNNEISGEFITSDGRPVKVFAVDIKDTYPIVGSVDNVLHHWDSEGECSTASEDDSLFINYNGEKFKSEDYVKYTKVSKDRKAGAPTPEVATEEPGDTDAETAEQNAGTATPEPEDDNINKTMNTAELIDDMFGKTE